jgi:putative ABC transport system substrate-binding protein
VAEYRAANMKRRRFIAGFCGTIAAWPLAAYSQQLRVVGILMNGSAHEPALEVNVTAVTQALRALGWVEGSNLRLEIRWNDGSADRARAHASELVGLAPSVILTASTNNLRAAQNASRIVPIVFLQVSDPVAQGFVSSVTKPGGNLTGFSALEFSIGGKWLELLQLMSPKLVRVGVMSNPETSPQSKFFQAAIEAAGRSFGVQVSAAPVRNDADIERVIENLGRQQDGGLILPTDSFTRLRRRLVVEQALRHRVPMISAFPEFIDEGGLMFYGPSSIENIEDQFRQAASYIDRILKGEKPGDLPIQGASKFSLFINRKTATALGLEIPARLHFTADKVIE